MALSRIAICAGGLLLAGCGGKTQAVRLPADFQRGMNYAHIHRAGHGYGSDVSAQQLAALHQLGVNWIAIMPFGYQHATMAAEVLGARDPTLEDANLTKEIAAAHRLGMCVTLKPHIWSRDFWDGHEWPGSIQQKSAEDHARWWASYRTLALHYAQVAAQAGADQYCLGNELALMTTRYPAEWRALIAEIRQVYHGPLTYAADWREEFDRIEFWDALDFIGVNAYFPLDAPPGASVEQLTQAWKPYRQRIEKLQKRVGKPVLFLELGYRPVADTYRKPWEYSGGQPDQAAQARAYEAVFRVFADKPWWKGVYWWKTFTDPGLTDRDDGEDYPFLGQPAEKVVRTWFGDSAR